MTFNRALSFLTCAASLILAVAWGWCVLSIAFATPADVSRTAEEMAEARPSILMFLLTGFIAWAIIAYRDLKDHARK